MDRIIKFRGKDIKTGEWVEGFYAMHHVPETDNHDKVTGFKEIPCIFNDEPGQRSKGSYWHEVDPDSVGQFTGCLDKHGNEVYEGDIVEFSEYVADYLLRTHKLEVFYSRGVFHPLAEIFSCGTDYDAGSKMLDCEVIGNIYDNKELLNE
jgi:hypothetical protein